MPFSKSLLRHPLAKSVLDDMTGDSSFQLYIPEPHPDHLAPPEQIKRHILCSGQVYYALLRSREQNKLNNVAISRIEQISPFPWSQVREHADKYPNAQIVWCQEEPLNMGAWSYVQPRITTTLAQTEHHKDSYPIYAARPPSASIATGNKKQHKQEEYTFLSKALLGVKKPVPKDIISGVPVWDVDQQQSDSASEAKQPSNDAAQSKGASQKEYDNKSSKKESGNKDALEAMGGAVDAIPKEEEPQEGGNKTAEQSRGFFGWLSGKQ